MILTYNFPCGKLIYLPDGNDDGYSDETDFDYEVTPTQEDFKEFFKINFKGMSVSDTERLCLEKGAEQQLKRIFDAMPDLEWWRDYLEEDDDFYEFMKERYYEEAMEEYNNAE